MSVNKLHDATQFKKIDYTDMCLGHEPGDPMPIWRVSLKDGRVLAANHFMNLKDLFKQPMVRFFIIDNADANRLVEILSHFKTDEEKAVKAKELTSSVKHFSKDVKRNHYVRVLPRISGDEKHETRVFTDEILEIIPVVLAQQGTSISDKDERLEKYRQRWHSYTLWHYNTIHVSQLDKVFEDFDIDKSLITLVEDPLYEVRRMELIARGVTMRVFNPKLIPVIEPYHAIDAVFTECVMGINWRTEMCTYHPYCSMQLKNKIVNCMYQYLMINPEYLFSYNAVKYAIKDIKRECIFHYLPERDTPEFRLNDYPVTMGIDWVEYFKITTFFDLNSFEQVLQGHPLIPVWLIRMFVKLAWIQQFFPKNDCRDLRKVVISGLLLSVPKEHTTYATHWVNGIIEATDAKFAATPEGIAILKAVEKAEQDRLASLHDPNSLYQRIKKQQDEAYS
ncbi:hypothetical protein CRE_02866 [Caenorhabditis remanei]|uniref:Uncharacterized protein n=1 Tax=Caenorhabditis remanei TaxID=31234 RepID=E3LWB6_CAERE|nr:hypothetical protein CRE_02866 [Caenorhabditis remanei]